MPIISIIIPVYKVEKYLRECLDSILNQTYTDWEALLIDDGSPDNSGAICDEYAAKDSRFRVFHKTNGGVSSARNMGIVKAQGDYITFVDSDDKLLPNTLDVCMGVIEKNDLDLLQFGFTRFYDCVYGGDSDQQYTVLTSQEFFNIKHNVCVGGGVFSRNVLVDNNILFREGMKLAEDQLFVLHSIRHSSRLMKIEDRLYYYRDNVESATHHSKVEDMINSCSILILEKRRCPEFAPVVDNTILMFVLSIVSQIEDREQLKAVLDMYEGANVQHCNRVHNSGRLFYYMSKINTMLASLVYLYYLRIVEKLR